MKFNSQICTSREQSERLLALGLKTETADMVWNDNALIAECEDWRPLPIYADWEEWQKDGIPAWSLHRLWELSIIKNIIIDSVDEIAVLYDLVIDRIEELINGGSFPKVYLEE